MRSSLAIHFSWLMMMRLTFCQCAAACIDVAVFMVRFRQDGVPTRRTCRLGSAYKHKHARTENVVDCSRGELRATTPGGTTHWTSSCITSHTPSSIPVGLWSDNDS